MVQLTNNTNVSPHIFTLKYVLVVVHQCHKKRKKEKKKQNDHNGYRYADSVLHYYDFF